MRGRGARPTVPPSHHEELVFASHRPLFCGLVLLSCSAVLVIEVAVNGWTFQPFTCPSTNSLGLPAYDDGSPCEANLMLGPTIAVLDRMGAKNDVAIFERGEWWRLLTCNWLHSGLFHLLLNMMGTIGLGLGLERIFGFWRTALLYNLSGLFGTLASAALLPGVISVGASASVFGLIGAYWADVVLNYCAKGTLRGTGFGGLVVSTIPNLLIGLTPWVDNFMHVGGFVTGGALACLLLPELRASARVMMPNESANRPRNRLQGRVGSPLGRRRRMQVEQWHRAADRLRGEGAALARTVDDAMRCSRVERLGAGVVRSVTRGRPRSKVHPAPRANAYTTPDLRQQAQPGATPQAHVQARTRYERLCGRLNVAQKAVVVVSMLIVAASTLASVSLVSSDFQRSLRACTACSAINCVELDWFTGQPWWSCCLATLPGSCTLELHNASIFGVCNVTGVPLYNASCDRADADCAWDLGSSKLCQKLCFGC